MEESVTEPPLVARGLHPAAIVWLLGVSQIIGYGTLYYSFSILAGGVATAFAWPPSWLYGSLSIALFLCGMIAPEVGRRIDRHGAGIVMTLGSGGAALSLLLAALAPNGWVFGLAVVLMQLAGALVLYDAAFAALVQAAGHDARQRITHLTLIAGFASTIFWPLTAWLQGMFGWREILIGFAAANLLVCVPIHMLLAQHHRDAGPAKTTPTQHHVPLPQGAQRRALWLVTLGFAFSGFALSAMLAQMVPMLTALGLSTSALLVSTLFGPAQVLVRFVNMLIGARHHPMTATLVAASMLPLAIMLLAITAPLVAGGLVFAVLLGFGSGLKSIVQGTLPLALFGSGAYGARLGVMASVRQSLAAIAPFALAFLIETLGAGPALWVMVGTGLAGVACMLELLRSTRSIPADGIDPGKDA